jgi:hypothetical protein
MNNLKPETFNPPPSHPSDHDLACVTEDSATEDVAAHVRDCARCRSAVADFRWLGDELEAVLAAAVETVPVPRPAWRAVRAHLTAIQRRQMVRGWASACASVLLAAGLMFGAPNFVNMAGLATTAQAAQAKAIIAPTPRPPIVTGASPATYVTSTPAVSNDHRAPLPTPAFKLPPTPPDPATPSG